MSAIYDKVTSDCSELQKHIWLLEEEIKYYTEKKDKDRVNRRKAILSAKKQIQEGNSCLVSPSQINAQLGVSTTSPTLINQAVVSNTPNAVVAESFVKNNLQYILMGVGALITVGFIVYKIKK